MDGDRDVLIVGYGPVGQLLAILLAQRGWAVTAVERWPRPFPMPRAVSYDGESARIVALTGIAPAIGAICEPSRDYVWRNAAGDTLLRIDVADPGQYGWPDSTSMYQPGLEAALAERGAALPSLTVLRGHRATDLVDRGDGVDVTVEDQHGVPRVLTARWVVGCDGANSFVRERAGIGVTDLGFSNDWLTCDVVVGDGRTFTPNNLQICDPVRPATVVSAGPGHRRWEFMRVPGEELGQLDSAAAAWRLLAPFDVTPANSELERHAVYTFQARYADRWRVGRVLLAGDAAHLMPPFAGQGMCSGFRDAANLAWKLDLVLAGTAEDSLLDTYTDERRAHVQHAIAMSVNLGKVICQADPKAAADRDTVMLARRRNPTAVQQPAMYQPLTAGALVSGAAAPVGSLCPQGRVHRDGVTGLFDDVVGTGFVCLATAPPRDLLDDAALAVLADYGTHLVHLVAPGEPARPGAVVDVDGVYRAYLATAGSAAIVVRPDFYAIAGGRDGADVSADVLDLRRRLAHGEAAVPTA
ncbi:bifunctional 3-(3-hydroxy-phenyl)propionate/3-hydroxycinnamic acid hydroxylase [Dactylosporangium sp. NPDC048998]|uniref:bifunctional 3-(3-hydroxy-phenyl)propionate/3-hydroxycinnamic acid hydroxylase MhpA n=1 Tax=Dactylosporangium sp. NPDC048998 TaxID=3363976 RepID=UPI0037242869